MAWSQRSLRWGRREAGTRRSLSGRSSSWLEPSYWTIHQWIKQADRDEGQSAEGLATAEREELRRLRRENRQLKLEREILAKAAAWFAQETGSVPKKSSSS